MSQRRRVLLVTLELYPFTAGGIGRLLHNLIVDSLARSAPVDFHLLVQDIGPIQPARVDAYFGGKVKVHFVQFATGEIPPVEFENVYPPASAFTGFPWHGRSIDVMRTIKRLVREGLIFDVIEFHDWGGLAFSTLQEKHLGLDFADSEIAIRLHSTEGILMRVEPRRVDIPLLSLFELERKALHDADRIIAHLPTIAQHNCDYYGFEPSWLRKVTVEFPPVTLVNSNKVPVSTDHKQPDLLFITKLQSCKQPELFVLGAAQFMRMHKDFRGKAIFACHAFDKSYREGVRSKIPKDLTERFVLSEEGFSQTEREKLMAGNIVVVPSAFESLCLAAYEAAQQGATLVLNGACLAFGDRTPFEDTINCHKFDGSVEGLVSALERAWRLPKPSPVSWTADIPYWEARQLNKPSPSREERRPRVSVIVTNYNLGRHLPETLASISGSTYSDIEVIIVDDASTESLDVALLAHLESEAAKGDTPIKILRNPLRRGFAASRNIGIRAAAGKYILPLDADARISTHFIEMGTRALETNSEFDIIVPSAAHFRTDEDLHTGSFSGYPMVLGDAPSLGLVGNRFSCATALLRRSLFDTHTYNEFLTCYEDWELFLRLALAGHRFLVTNEINFYCRQRFDSTEIVTKDPGQYFDLLARIFEALPTPLPRSVHLSGLVALAMESPQIDLLEQQIQAQQASIDAKDQALNMIITSLAWRLILKYRKVKDKIIPLGSSRRRLYDFLLLALKRTNGTIQQ